MHARSALFDAYGDHLRTRGSEAPVAALVRLLAPVGIAAPAVRTAISRMVIQGWLEPLQLPGGRGYRATAQAIRRLDTAAERVYRTNSVTWDGTWHLVLLESISARSHRNRVRAGLGWLGYGELADGVWISPYPRGELADLLRRAEADATTAVVSDFVPEQRPARAWDLAALGREYAAWLSDAADLVAAHARDHADPDEAAFASRFHLVHDWRKFLFRDPGLPDVLLPEPWPGRDAAEFFSTEAARLKPGADRFVDHCLSTTERTTTP